MLGILRDWTEPKDRLLQIGKLPRHHRRQFGTVLVVVMHFRTFQEFEIVFINFSDQQTF